MERELKDYAEIAREVHYKRALLVKLLDAALKRGLLTQKERDVLYRREIDWNSLETVAKHFGVTRERIRQIEAKALEKLRISTQVVLLTNNT